MYQCMDGRLELRNEGRDQQRLELTQIAQSTMRRRMLTISSLEAVVSVRSIGEPSTQMRLKQIELYHCQLARKRLLQNICKKDIDVVIISEPYRNHGGGI